MLHWSLIKLKWRFYRFCAGNIGKQIATRNYTKYLGKILAPKMNNDTNNVMRSQFERVRVSFYSLNYKENYSFEAQCKRLTSSIAEHNFGCTSENARLL